MGSAQNKGSALAFLFVLLVMCLGAWAACSALTRGRGSQVVAVESWTPTQSMATLPPDATFVPTDVAVETTPVDSELSTPVVPSPTPVPPATPAPPPSATPTPVASPTSQEAEPGTPPASNEFQVKSNERDCSRGNLIGGWVYDAAGSGLPWANLRLYNDYDFDEVKKSEGPPQAGKYEFTIFDAGLFHLVLEDNDGRALSPVVHIDYQPNCSQRVDWERVP